MGKLKNPNGGADEDVNESMRMNNPASHHDVNFANLQINDVDERVNLTKFNDDDVNESTEYTIYGDDDDVRDDVSDLKPDDIIMQLGGCGLFQILLSSIIQFMKIVICWGMTNAFFAFVPRWRCAEFEDLPSGYISNATEQVNQSMTSSMTSFDDDGYWDQKCNLGQASCVKFEYESGMHTLVTEFDLVCDKSWVTATIVSVQMAGMMFGSILVGHLGDMFGRKKPFVLSMAILFVFNMVCYFSVSWVMFAVGKFFIGLGSAFFLSIYCILQGEYTLSKWRSTVISFPSWAIEKCLFVLVAWLLHDWEYMILIIALGSLAFLSTWFFIPESFRWEIARNKMKAGRKTVEQVAKWNNRPINNDDFSRMCTAIEKHTSVENESYSLIALFTRWSLLKLMLPMLTCWLALGVVAYGIGFGIKKLSGNFFLNLFLFSLASIPSKLLSIYLQIRFGRKVTSMLSYGMCLVGGLVVGIVQYIDTPHKVSLTNYCALAASAGVDAAWGAIQTLTVEVFPTVARNTAFGFLSTLARLGAVIGPQFVFLEDFVPGLLYFVVAGLSLISMICLLFLPETNNTTLVDNITDDLDKDRRSEYVIAKRK